MVSEGNNLLVKLLSTIKEISTPIQLGALSIAVLYLVFTGPYTQQDRNYVLGGIILMLCISVIPYWRKNEVDTEIELRRIKAEIEKGRDFTQITQRGSIERLRIEGVQRKQEHLTHILH